MLVMRLGLVSILKYNDLMFRAWIRTVIAYDVPIEPFNLDEISEYMYQKHGSIWFVIQNSTVVEYGWFVGAMAE